MAEQTYKATREGGALQEIPDCYIFIPGAYIDQRGFRAPGRIRLKILPDIGDRKNANYVGEPIQGRAMPLKTYSHSEDRQITMTLHFMITQEGDAALHLTYLRWIQSALYPREVMDSGFIYIPPPICSLKCGELLGSYATDKQTSRNRGAISAILSDYSVRFPTDTAWDTQFYVPMRFSVDTTWIVVYPSSALPGQNRIVNFGA